MLKGYKQISGAEPWGYVWQLNSSV